VRSVARWLAAPVVSCVLGVAGCASATPSPTPTGPASVSAPASATPVVAAEPTATATPGLSDEMEFGSLDPELSNTILEFASDGESVLFSSGVEEDAAPGAAPDLWGVNVDVPEPTPELLWRNPERDHSIVKIAGDLGMIAFTDLPLDGGRAWNLWLIPRHSDEPILLDTHPGDEAVPSFVPSFSVEELMIVWTAFDIGPDGPVSQLLMARDPGWEPTLVLERPAAEAELWFPSLSGGTVVYCQVTYSEDRTSDTRSVHLIELSLDGPSEPQRLDHSDLATMPVIEAGTVIWKEADPGFNMFNWGKLWRYDIGGPGPVPLDTSPLEYVNYPSLGSRFVAWWAADSYQLVVYDLLQDRPRVVETYPAAGDVSVLRPHVAWDLLTWLYVEGEGPDSLAEVRYAKLPRLRELP
jgi:hypothetical protein